MSIPKDIKYKVIHKSNNIGMNIEQYAYEVGFFRFNWHSDIEIMLVLNGSLTAYVNGKPVDLETDDLLIINAYEGHATKLTSPNTAVIVLHCNPVEISRLIGRDEAIHFSCKSDSSTRLTYQYAIMRYYLATIYKELNSKTEIGKVVAEGAYQMMCGVMLRYFNPQVLTERKVNNNATQLKKLKQIISYTDKHFQEKITLDELSALVDMNRTYISTFFKNHVGISFYDYLTRKRLMHAGHILNNTDMPILDIALESGFCDAKAFNSAFNHYFKIAPDKYRKQLDKNLYNNTAAPLPSFIDINSPIVKNKLEQYLNAFLYPRYFA